tara:strand:+ start:1066 stop:1401 length:336 start_codon:yes stop_codon:yes gene_type:complete
MKTPHAILIGLSLIAMAIFVNGQVTAPAIASEDQNVWRSTSNPMDFYVQKNNFCEFYKPMIAGMMDANLYWREHGAKEENLRGKADAQKKANENFKLILHTAPVYSAYCKD